MRILGIDPGLQKTGWGIIEITGSALRFLASGRAVTKGEMPTPDRLAALDRALETVIDSWAPEEAAVEEIFVNANPASAMKLGLARGVALCVPARKGLPVAEYPANKVKKSVVGAGHAAKVQVGAMIRMLLPNCGPVSADEADALAIAICHAHHRTSPALTYARM